MEIKGKIKKIFDTETFKNDFKKKDIVITTQEQYPQDIVIQFTQDKILLLNDYKVGNLVNVYFNIRGKEWTNPQGVKKYFNSLEGWRIQKVEDKSPKMPPAPKDEIDISDSGDFDDLPF